MAHVITGACRDCKDTACTTVCPTDCIHPTKDETAFEAAEQLYIDPDACVDCGLCVSECPVKAIFQDDDLPEELRRFIEVNRVWYAKA